MYLYLCECGYFSIWFSVVCCLTWVNQQSTGRASWKIVVSAGKTALCCSMGTARTRWHSLLPDGKRDNSRGTRCSPPLQGCALPCCPLLHPSFDHSSPAALAGWTHCRLVCCLSNPLLWLMPTLCPHTAQSTGKLWRIIWLASKFFCHPPALHKIPAYIFIPFWWIWTGDKCIYSSVEQVSISAAIPLVLLAPATAWSECSWDHQDSWLRVQNPLAPPGEYKRGWHNLGLHRLFWQTQIPPGWACFRLALSASKEPQVSENARERNSTSFFLSPSAGSSLPSDGTALRNEKRQKKSLC